MPTADDSLVVGIETALEGLDPTRSRLDIPSMVAALAVYDPLAAYAQDGSVRPYLAESIEPGEGFLSWRITVRDGLAFHDGAQIDGEAVACNFREQLASPLTSLALANVAGVAVAGPRTVEVSMHEPWAAFPAFLTGQLGLMASPSTIGTDRLPVGSGPFQAVELSGGTLVAKAAAPGRGRWRAEAPGVAEVRFTPVIEPAERYARLLDGGIDVFHTTDAEAITGMRADPAVELFEDSGGTSDTGCVMLNTAAPPLDDIRLRRALAHALDRQALVAQIFGGLVPAASSPFGRASRWWSPVDYPAFDPAAARRLAAEVAADLGGPPAVRLTTTTTAKNKLTAELIAGMWEAVGVTVSIAQVEQQDYILQALFGSYQACEWHQFGAGDPDENFIFWSPATAQPVGDLSLNMTRNDDAELGAALLQGRRSADPQARAKAYRQAAARLAETLPYLWINETPYAVAWRRGDLHGVGRPVLPDGSPGLGLIAGRFTVGHIRRGDGVR